MSRLKNLQKVFDKEYDKVKKQHLKDVLRKLKAGKGIALQTKVYDAKREVLEHINHYTNFSFTKHLLDFYYAEQSKFDTITFFINYKLEELVTKYHDLFQSPQIEYELTAEGIVKLIAKDYALRIIYSNLDAITLEESDTADTCFNKLILEYGYEDILLKQSIHYHKPIVLKELTKEEELVIEEENIDFNFYNENCYLLFKYLAKNYQKSGKVKYINIYYFLKKMAKDDSDHYRFSMKIDKEYKPMIKELFQVEITKFKTADIAFAETEIPKLKDLERKFRNERKST